MSKDRNIRDIRSNLIMPKIDNIHDFLAIKCKTFFFTFTRDVTAIDDPNDRSYRKDTRVRNIRTCIIKKQFTIVIIKRIERN